MPTTTVETSIQNSLRKYANFIAATCEVADYIQDCPNNCFKKFKDVFHNYGLDSLVSVEMGCTPSPGL